MVELGCGSVGGTDLPYLFAVFDRCPFYSWEIQVAVFFYLDNFLRIFFEDTILYSDQPVLAGSYVFDIELSLAVCSCPEGVAFGASLEIRSVAVLEVRQDNECV